MLMRRLRRTAPDVTRRISQRRIRDRRNPAGATRIPVDLACLADTPGEMERTRGLLFLLSFYAAGCSGAGSALTSVTIADGDQTLEVGRTLTLTARPTPADAHLPTVIWRSSDLAVAPVDGDGVLRALASGSAVVTADVGAGVSASIAVTVTLPSSPALSAIAIHQGDQALSAGDQLALTIDRTPADAAAPALTWTSSTPAVATVDTHGQLHAVGAGRTTITADAGGGITATMAITVSLPAVTALQIQEGSRTLICGDSLALHVDSAPPYSAPGALVWTSSMPDIIAVDALGQVTAIETGSAIISVSDGTHADQVLVSSVPKVPITLPTLTQSPFPAHAWTTATMLERAPTPPPADQPDARILSEYWMEIELPEVAYDGTAVESPANYALTSVDDPGYATAVTPARVQHRHFPEKAPYNASGDVAHITVIYRIYLQAPLGQPFVAGRHYAVAIAPAVAAVAPLAATFDGTGAHRIIHVNQEAYPEVGPKIAYLSWWLGPGNVGQPSSIDFSLYPTFSLIDESSASPVFSAPIAVEALAEPYSGSDVYRLDFSSFTTPGTYHVAIAGIGNSYSFKIGPTAFNFVAATAIRGVTQTRDGNHGLDDPLVTHWNRPPAHLDDAIEQSTQGHVDLIGGHMDAGDRGKYPIDIALTAADLLSAMRLYPDRVEALGEGLQIPESGNGIPDYLDETIYELDELYKMVAYTHQDGTVAMYLRPSNDGYELGLGPEGAPGRVWFDVTYGHQKNATLAAAGALAMAFNDPLIRKYAPDRAQAYLGAALRAFLGFELHENDTSYWYVSPPADTNAVTGLHPWSSEMVFAAAHLLQATGDTKYLDRLVAEWPQDPLSVLHWGNDPGGFWLHAFLGVYDAAWADFLDQLPAGRSVFGIFFPSQVSGAVGWFHTESWTGLPSLLAWGVTGDTRYRDHLAQCWSYLLGSNPQGVSHISGLGDPSVRPRWFVNELSYYEWFQYQSGTGGWPEPPPGIPDADIQYGAYDWWFSDPWNLARIANMDPIRADVPVFYRYIDAWNATNETSIYDSAALAACALPFVR
jgi:uncharacterized protein YjdB